MSALKRFEQWFIRVQFSGKARLRIYRKLSRLQKNGVSMPDALRTMWNHESQDGKKKTKPSAIALEAWRKQVDNGKILGIAIQGWVPENDRLVIEAGERAGALAQSLDDSIFIYLGQKRIKEALFMGLAYPIFLFFVAIGLLIIVGTNIVPTFDSILPRDRWTGAGASMAWLADFVNVAMIPALVGIAGLVIAIIWSMPRWTGRVRIRMDRFPPYSLYKLVQGSGFLLSFATMVKAGIKTTDALRLMQRDASPWLMERLSKTLNIMNNGANIGEALYRSRLEFPDQETANDLRTYAELDKFDEALVVIGRENLEETVHRIEQQSAAMKNGGILLLAVIFGWIAAGIFSLQQQMSATF